MTLYEKYRGLDIDLAPLGLGRGDARGDYFCDPLGAEVIGWAGVDGIHFCFVEGFGETVFAVSPANGPGEYLHPLARSFEDFLRLVLACGGVDALEQAWMWSRGEFDAFLETYPPDAEQRAALDGLAQALSLTPMDDPYGYIKEVQSSFDARGLRFSQKYYELAGEEGPAAPLEPPEWAAYYGGGFWDGGGRGRPGTELPVGKTFSWQGTLWHVPAVYACGKGLVVDLCVEIDPARMGAFWEKWGPRLREGREFTPEEREQQSMDNPMDLDFDVRAVVNGREIRARRGCGFGWTPPNCVPDWTESEKMPGRQYYEGLWLLERYGLPTDRCWMFWRQSFPWATRRRPAVRTLSLVLEGRPKPVPGPRFTVSGPGDRVELANPITGRIHTLRVVEYEAEEIDAGFRDGWEYPTHCTVMTYAVEPELPRGALTVLDTEEGDSPRPRCQEGPANLGGADGPAACSIGIIGGADGPTAIFVAGTRATLDSDPPQLRSACSALRFAPPKGVQWRTTFQEAAPDGTSVELLS